MKPLTLGLVGLDTSHVEALAALFNDPSNPDHLTGARVVAGFPGGSPDFPLSIDRMPDYTRKLQDRYGVNILGSAHEVATVSDAVLLTAVDGRSHLKLFEEIAPLRRPTFIDKPLATTSYDARAIAMIARDQNVPTFSASSLRFADGLRTALSNSDSGQITGADFCGPLHLQPTQPGFFWYGIHCVEMLFTVMGRGCRSVRMTSAPEHEIAIGLWTDGRLGLVRGNRVGNNAFTGVIHRERADQWINASTGKPFYIGLAAAILAFARGNPPPVLLDETLEIIRFIEAANESRATGGCEVAL